MVKAFLLSAIYHNYEMTDYLAYADPKEDLIQATSLIQAEMKKMARPTIPAFTDVKPEKTQAIDTTRLGMPAPSTESVTEYEKSVANAKSQLMHQVNRYTNLSLLAEYGPDAYKQFIEYLRLQEAVVNRELENVTKEVEDLNKQRKEAQEMAGSEIRRLNDSHKELVNRVIQVDMANLALKEEIARLESH